MVNKWLRKQYTYTVHRPARKRFKRNPVIVRSLDQQWQADLCDLKDMSRWNQGRKYILTVVDCLSKFAFARTLTLKSGTQVRSAFASIFKHRKPLSLQTDKGKEFTNDIIAQFMKGHGVHHFFAGNDVKCSIVERFNRTLKNRLFKYMTHKSTKTYTPILQQAVSAYNRSINRSTGKRPIDVTYANQKEVFRRLHGGQTVRQLLKQREKAKLRRGNLVRVSKHGNVFARGFKPKWSQETFTVDKVVPRGIPVYRIRDEAGDPIKGTWYPYEVQHVEATPATTHRIERIIRERTTDGQLEYYVHWQGYPASSRSWIPASAVVPINSADHGASGT